MGLTRGAKTLTLQGSITVTIADELLTFQFDAAGKPGPAAAQKGVVVTATKFGPTAATGVGRLRAPGHLRTGSGRSGGSR